MNSAVFILLAILSYGNPYSIGKSLLSFRRGFHVLKASISDSSSNGDINKKITQVGKASAELVLSVTAKGNDVFDFSKSSNILTSEMFNLWERQVDDVISELTQFTRKDAVMSVYKSILTKASPIPLDPLQQATFEVFSNTLVDTLIKIHPEGAPITIVIDSLTNLHLSFIDDFARIINEKRLGADTTPEFLSYQFAGLLLKIYGRVIASMGMGYDTTQSVQEMRLNHWVDPVFKKMETTCPGFSTLSVDEKLEEMYASAFDDMLGKVKLELSPAYALKPTETPISARIGNATHPSWAFANFISKLIRNTFSNIEVSTLDNKVLRMYQSELSTRMRRVGRQLEKLASEDRIASTDKEIASIEEMLNIGHLLVAGVYTIWHVRHNIVGTKNEEGVPVKDFLMPITMSDFDKTMECVPKHMRTEVLSDIQLLTDRYPNLPSYLKAAMTLSHTVRSTAAEDYRALITYNANSDDWPDSRDDVFVSVLSAYLSTLLSGASTAPADGDYSVAELENMIALAALDEGIGAREPRAAVSKAYTLALQNAVQALLAGGGDPTAAVEKLKKRIQRTELLLSTCLRLPAGSGAKCGQAAFKSVVEAILTTASTGTQPSSFKRLEKVYPVVAQALSIDLRAAQAFVIPLGLRRFDKSVGNMLMNADLSFSMPEMGDAFRSQLHEMADDISLEKSIADKRVVRIAAAVLQSFFEALLEESRRANFKNVDTVLAKAFYLCQHPLILKLEKEAGGADPTSSVLPSAVEATATRLGSALFVELLRSVESAKQRLTGAGSESSTGSANAGWGGGGSSLSSALVADPRFPQFLGALQTALLKQYTASAMKASFGR